MTADRRRLLAGSVGPERIPARPDPHDADWFLPLHLRDERGARERIAAQIVAGADVVVAPTWLTHRRALLPLGETRRAGDWTAAAVRVAREAVELGLERREETLAEAAEDDVRRTRPRLLVAASLPALDDESEVASGRLLPREAATARDYRDQAGLLADAEPDLILVEGQRTEADARAAMAEAVETGLPVWAALSPGAVATAGLEDWLEWTSGAGLTRLLWPPPLDEAAAEGELPWGGLVDEPDAVGPWLDAGADVMALLDRASGALLEPLRAAVDDYERAELKAAGAITARWRRAVARAAAMAPGGAAAWIGPEPEDPLPDGFAWLVVDPAESRHLPAQHFGLVVAVEGLRPGFEHMLREGGIAVGPAEGPTTLRPLVIDDETEPPLRIARREH